MRDGHRVFDADAHVVYPADLWDKFLDERFRHRIGRRAPAGLDTYNPVTVDGRWTQHPTTLYGQFQKAINWTTQDMIDKYGEEMVVQGFTGDRVARALEVEGVDIMVVYGPEYDMWLDGIDPELQAAMARAYNRWGQEMRETSGNRVHVSGPVPLNDVSRALEEIQYAYDHLGVRCFWARNNHVNHRNLGDRYYDPVWELLQDLDVAFGTHEFMGLNGPSEGSERFFTFTEWHTIVHPFETMSSVVSMISNGVYERFPRLRVAYMEAGCGWLPSWLHRLDEHLELAGEREFPELTMSATDYFRRNCWISAECEDHFVADVIRWMGDDHIVYETDFPHPDSKYPHATSTFLSLLPDQISADSKRKVLWDNAVDLYRFPDSHYPASVAEGSTAVPVA
jgi:predicted TIM-barrel fold metal-dependent hydrolase